MSPLPWTQQPRTVGFAGDARSRVARADTAAAVDPHHPYVTRRSRGPRHSRRLPLLLLPMLLMGRASFSLAATRTSNDPVSLVRTTRPLTHTASTSRRSPSLALDHVLRPSPPLLPLASEVSDIPDHVIMATQPFLPERNNVPRSAAIERAETVLIRNQGSVIDSQPDDRNHEESPLPITAETLVRVTALPPAAVTSWRTRRRLLNENDLAIPPTKLTESPTPAPVDTVEMEADSDTEAPDDNGKDDEETPSPTTPIDGVSTTTAAPSCAPQAIAPSPPPVPPEVTSSPVAESGAHGKTTGVPTNSPRLGQAEGPAAEAAGTPTDDVTLNPTAPTPVPPPTAEPTQHPKTPPPESPTSRTDSTPIDDDTVRDDDLPVARIAGLLFLVAFVCTALICLGRRMTGRSKANRANYQGVATDEGDAVGDDGDWGWEEDHYSQDDVEMPAVSKSHSVSSPPSPPRSNRSMRSGSLTSVRSTSSSPNGDHGYQSRQSYPKPSSPNVSSMTAPQHFLPSNAAAYPPQQQHPTLMVTPIPPVTVTAAAAPKPKKVVVPEEDIFATMGFSAKPTFSHPTLPPTSNTSTTGLPSTWRTTTGITAATVAATSHRSPTLIPTAASNASMHSEVVAEWADDGDLDDLLDD